MMVGVYSGIAAMFLLVALMITGSTVGEWDRVERLLLLGILVVGSALWPLSLAALTAWSLASVMRGMAGWVR